eukprot:1423276-Rhodomonas_salina.1
MKRQTDSTESTKNPGRLCMHSCLMLKPSLLRFSSTSFHHQQQQHQQPQVKSPLQLPPPPPPPPRCSAAGDIVALGVFVQGMR